MILEAEIQSFFDPDAFYRDYAGLLLSAVGGREGETVNVFLLEPDCLLVESLRREALARNVRLAAYSFRDQSAEAREAVSTCEATIQLLSPEAMPGAAAPTAVAPPLERSGSWGFPHVHAANPTEAWAAAVFPDPDSMGSLTKLLESLARILKLRGPGAWDWSAWLLRYELLDARARWLSELGAKSLHFESASTSLEVPLRPDSIWVAPRTRSRGGVHFVPNIPCNEIFTRPAGDHLDGHVNCLKPARPGEPNHSEVKLTFEPGSTPTIVGPGAHELSQGEPKGVGEIALVESDPMLSDLAPLGDILTAENLACHLALGIPIPGTHREPERFGSVKHIDLPFVEPVSVTAKTRLGEIQLMDAGIWIAGTG